MAKEFLMAAFVVVVLALASREPQGKVDIGPLVMEQPAIARPLDAPRCPKQDVDGMPLLLSIATRADDGEWSLYCDYDKNFHEGAKQ